VRSRQGSVTGESPGLRAHHGLQHDAGAQGLPGGGAAQGELELAGLARHQLIAGVLEFAHADDLDVEASVAGAHHAAHHALEDAPVKSPIEILEARNEELIGEPLRVGWVRGVTPPLVLQQKGEF
jgi:hypothetical protein